MTKIHFVFLNNSYIYTAILQFIFDVQNHRYFVVCDFHSNLSRILLEVIQKTKSGCSCERNVYVAYRSNCTVDIRASYRRARLKPSNVGVHDLKKISSMFSYRQSQWLSFSSRFQAVRQLHWKMVPVLLS